MVFLRVWWCLCAYVPLPIDSLVRHLELLSTTSIPYCNMFDARPLPYENVIKNSPFNLLDPLLNPRTTQMKRHVAFVVASPSMDDTYGFRCPNRYHMI